MPIPVGVETVTISSGAPLTLPDGTPIRGHFRFVAVDLAIIDDENYIFGGETSAELHGGAFSVVLVPPDATDISPTGWTYMCIAEFSNAPGWTRYLDISKNLPEVFLDDALVLTPGDPVFPDTQFVHVSGSTMTGHLTLSGAPTQDLHAATKLYVDEHGGDTTGLVQKSGSTMTGPLILSGAPTVDLQAATKKYVDDNAGGDTSGLVQKSGDTMTGPLVLPGSDPATANQASRKAYVDAGDTAVAGSVTTLSGTVGTLDAQNVKLTGPQTVSGVKTFGSFPVGPSSAPTTDYQVANKKYVDDNAGSPTPAWLFNVLDYAAIGNAQVLGDVTMASGSAVVNSASATWDDTVINTSASIKGAAVLGQTTAHGTVVSRQSATQITVSFTNDSGGDLSHGVIIWGHDDTAMIQAAIDAAEAYLVDNEYAQVYFPPFPYIIAGALNTTKSGNGQLVFGPQPTTDVKKILEFRGETGGTSAVRHWLQTVPQFAGSCLISFGVYANPSAQTADINAHGNPGVICGPNEASGYGVAANFSNMMPIIRNLAFLTAHSSFGLTYGAANLWGCANAIVENFSTGTAGTVASPSNDYSSPGTFGTGLSVALLMPAPGNNDNLIASNISIAGGYTYAMFITEHTVMDRYMALYCWAGLCPVGTYASSVGSVHGIKILTASIEACATEVYIIGPGSEGVGPTIDIDQLSTENGAPKFDGNSTGAMMSTLGLIKLTGLFNEAGVFTTQPFGLEIRNGKVPRAIKRKTADFTVSVIDRTLICDTTAGAIAATLPDADVNPVEYDFKNVGANNLVVGTTASQVIYTDDGTGHSTITLTIGQSLRVQAMYNGTSWGWYAL